MTRRVTIKDLARELGISHSTVARALTGNPHVLPETKARVLEAAAKLGYVVNSGARILRAGTSTIVGFVIPDVQNEVMAVSAKSIGECCVANGHQMVLSNSDEDPDLELASIRALAEIRAAGAVVMLTSSPRRETLNLLKEFPVVQILRRNAALNADWVGIDDGESMALAARHLIELGHTRIGYVGGVIELNTGSDRLAGYRRVLEEHGLPYDETIVSTGSVRAGFARGTVEPLLRADPRPTAVIGAGSRITLGVLEGLEALGLRIPDDLSVVGYTDPSWLRGWGPGITTVSVPIREVGAAAGALVMKRVHEDWSPNDASIVPVSSTFAPSLVVRGSTSSRQ
ncbi:MAG: LacI family DNA-binding transcriptional regulator [Rhodospirillales bacterium]|jgi:LacI family transcriptional regulator|nr:LacI family DNA-binding transcriptional regulator [Rhodospirillales bacterium]